VKRAPKVGTRVRYPGGLVVGPCVGIVEKVYVTHAFDEDRSDEWNARNSPPLPEPDWKVRMKPDVLPAKWCYSGCDAFAPSVADLEPE
jgi:hypothetical protein